MSKDQVYLQSGVLFVQGLFEIPTKGKQGNGLLELLCLPDFGRFNPQDMNAIKLLRMGMMGMLIIAYNVYLMTLLQKLMHQVRIKIPFTPGGPGNAYKENIHGILNQTYISGLRD